MGGDPDWSAVSNFFLRLGFRTRSSRLRRSHLMHTLDLLCLKRNMGQLAVAVKINIIELSRRNVRRFIGFADTGKFRWDVFLPKG